jgi:predicted Zn-dependent peptidase
LALASVSVGICAYTELSNTVSLVDQILAIKSKEFQLREVDLLADILRPSLRPEDFDLEKKVILDEIAVYDDQPHFRIYEKLMAEHFRSHPLGNSILGTRESIGGLRREAMIEMVKLYWIKPQPVLGETEDQEEAC